MSTITPFVRIEGSINQPRPSALDYSLPPFGDEWALLPPEASLRAELCALLRTFCLHDETMWSMCHWASAWPGRTSVPLAEPARSIATPPGESGLMDGFAQRTALDEPAVPGRFTHHDGVRVASACAIGAAAIFAWGAIAWLSQRHTPPHVTSAQQPGVAKEIAASVPLRDVGHPSAKPTLAPVVSQPHRVEAKHARRGIHNAGGVTRQKAHHPGSQINNRIRRPATTGSSVAPPHLSPSAATQRSSARPSAAGGYSPFAPATLGIDEYAPVTITNARQRDAAPAPTTVRHGNLGDTEWMDHISQRRVTEVPDEFSK